jgi:hypothetical protein
MISLEKLEEYIAFYIKTIIPQALGVKVRWSNSERDEIIDFYTKFIRGMKGYSEGIIDYSNLSECEVTKNNRIK